MGLVRHRRTSIAGVWCVHTLMGEVDRWRDVPNPDSYAMMSRMALKDDVRDERIELLRVLESLGPDQWTQLSLCTQWTVRDVVAHLVSYDGTNIVAFVLLFIATGFSVNRTNDVLLDAGADDRTNAFLSPFGGAPGAGG